MLQSVHVNHVVDANRFNMKAPSPPETKCENTQNTVGYGLQNTITKLVFVNVYLKSVPVSGKELVLIT